MLRSRTGLVIAFLGLSLIGTLVVQYFWALNSYDLARIEFDRQVNGLLEQVSLQLEEEELRNYLQQIDTLDMTGAKMRVPRDRTIDPKIEEERMALVNRLMFSFEASEKIEDRISVEQVKSMLSQGFLQRKLAVNYSWSIMVNHGADWYPQALRPVKGSEIYRAPLFPQDAVNQGNFLVVSVADLGAFIFKSNQWLLLGMVAFAVVSILAYLLFVSILIKQKRVVAMKNDFINNLTHEFKTPLATITIAANSIQNEKALNDKGMVMQLAETVKDETFRMNHQIERVLQVASANEGHLTIIPKPVDLVTLCKASIDSMEVILRKRQGNIEYVGPEQCVVEVDAHHLGQVIRNLLDNAIKYCHGAPKIKVILESLNSQVTLKVKDNGIGMAQQVQNNIFQPFYRFKDAEVYGVPGFGLGLSYVKSVVDGHGGEISVESRPKEGSQFVLTFPKASS